MATILKNKFEGNFVIVPKAFLTDESLKLRERGLIATILSFPEGWNFNVKRLMKITSEGRDSIHTSIKILKEKGYLVEYQDRDDNGKFGRSIIEICPESNIPCTEKPYTAKPDTVKPKTGKPNPANQPQYNNKELNNNRLNNNRLNNNRCKESEEKFHGRDWTDEEQRLYRL